MKQNFLWGTATGFLALTAFWAPESWSDGIAPAGKTHIEQIHSSLNCGSTNVSREGVRLRTRAEFKSAWEKITAGQFPPPLPPEVDFAKRHAILVGLGQKPNGGYGLELGTERGYLRGSALKIRLVETRPKPEAITPQVVVSPCLILGIDKSIKRFAVVYRIKE